MAFANFSRLISYQGNFSGAQAKALTGVLLFAKITSGYTLDGEKEQVEYPLYMVWAHNQWLRMPDAASFFALKEQVADHETRIAVLEEAKANFTVTDGKAIDLTYENGVLSAEAVISKKEGNGVALEDDGLFVDVKSLEDAIAAEKERAEGVEGDLQDAIDAEKERAEGAEGDLQDAIDAEQERAEEAEGDLSDRIDALENETRISLADGEKILSLGATDKKLATTLTIDIEKQGEGDAAKEYIVLKGVSGAEVSKVDASAFVKDGMLSNAELVTVAEEGVTEAVPYIKLTWNTDGGNKILRFSVKDLVDTYTSGDENLLTVEGYEITPVTSAIAENATGLAVAGDVYDAIAAKNVAAEGDDLVEASADGNKVTVAASEQLTAAVEKIEGLSVSATEGVTLGEVTYKYEHPTFEAAEAAAVKVGRDAEGHVVLGDALDAADIALASDKDLLADADNVEAGLEALADAIDAVDQSETTVAKKSATEFISLEDSAAADSNDHAYTIGLTVVEAPALVEGATSSIPTATGLASDKYVADSITNALAWEVIA